MELRDLLKKAGFSEKEIDVYLALAAGGPAVASDIAQQAKINRSTTYIILDALVKRGLAQESGSRSVKLFTPTEPEALVEYLNRAADHFSGLAKETRRLLPSLKRGVRSQKPETDSAYGAALASLEQIRAKIPEKPNRNKVSNKGLRPAPKIA